MRRDVIELIDATGLTPIVSPHLLAELTEVPMRDKFRVYLSVERASAYIAELERLAELWRDPPDTGAVSPDPDDDYLIALSRAVDAVAVVSGDRDHLVIRSPKSRPRAGISAFPGPPSERLAGARSACTQNPPSTSILRRRRGAA